MGDIGFNTYRESPIGVKKTFKISNIHTSRYFRIDDTEELIISSDISCKHRLCRVKMKAKHCNDNKTAAVFMPPHTCDNYLFGECVRQTASIQT